MAQWLIHHSSSIGGGYSITDQRTRILYAALKGQKYRKKKFKKVILENATITCIQKAKLFQPESTHWIIKKNKTKTVFSAWRNTRLSRILRRSQVTIEFIKDQGT